ncbi:hypothetical protein [Streptomyces sp. gb14]|uniref:hypothetical protein n=1 Tax=Streptomyces sp. gb14 TaxID=1827753 RepID=UPI00211D2723|nr:hypothetical protein [Streptomyces sp. gb14]
MWRPGHGIVYSLAECEKRVLYLRFFEGKIRSAIDAELGVSQMHVSRLTAKPEKAPLPKQNTSPSAPGPHVNVAFRMHRRAQQRNCATASAPWSPNPDEHLDDRLGAEAGVRLVACTAPAP